MRESPNCLHGRRYKYVLQYSTRSSFVCTHTQEFGARLYRVTVSFVDSRGERRLVRWVVKEAAQAHAHAHDQAQAQAQAQALRVLSHEIKVYTCLIEELRSFLSSRSNPRAKFLLNIPDLIHQERRFQDGTLSR